MAENKSRRGFSSRIRTALLLIAVNVVLLVLVDGLLVATGLLRPPIVYGDRDVGFFGDRKFVTSRDFGVEPDFPADVGIEIAMIGDSHSELGPMDRAAFRHQFVFESALRDAGYPAVIISAGRGRYAPTQEYVLYRSRITKEFDPDVVVMNLYAGNDFYDMLRPDDRPYFDRDGNGRIVMRPPMWNTFANPDGNKWWIESRLRWLFNEALGALGYPRIISRVRALAVTTRRIGGGPRDMVAYLRDVNRSIEPRLGYYAGFSAQILNQALFFEYFPSGRKECLVYLEELIALARRENPDVVFVMAPIPSALLAGAMPESVQPLWKDTVARVGLDENRVRDLERELYEALRQMCARHGWVFVDVLAAMQRAGDLQSMYSEDDLHVTESACRVIGQAEAAALSRSGVLDAVRTENGE